MIMPDRIRSRLVENMLEAETMQRMKCGQHAFDLNPIEHVWDMLGRRPGRLLLSETWRLHFLRGNSIPQRLIDNLIASMANSVQQS
ncbi:hypothetical protein TNCV_2347811, partial [Trichonephila clavipes]